MLMTSVQSVKVAAAATVVAAGAWLSSAGSGQILQINGDTLTNYRASASRVQGVKPRFEQRGTGLDGALNAGPAFSWSLAGNPFESGAPARLGDVRLDLGTYQPFVIDLALPAKGLPWAVGRTYNARQLDSAGTGRADSDGPQGKNWFQVSMPEIRLFSGATADKDVLYVVYGAERFVELKRTGVSSNEFLGRNGSGAAAQYVAGSPDTYVLYDTSGTRVYFFGGNTSGGKADWQFWKMADAAGNTTFVGDAASATTAVSSGYDAGGRITTAYDASDRRYTYTYTTIDSVVRLTQVKAETKAGGTWASPSGVTMVGQVDYSYYTGNNAYGDNGNLRLVTTTTPLSNGTDTLVRKQMYRYWVGAYNATTNRGHPNFVQYVVDAEGYRRADWADSTFNDTPLTMSETSLKAYASAYFEYDASFRVDKTWTNGECGCSGSTNGVHELSYGQSTSYSTYVGNTTYDSAFARRTVVKQPDGTYATHYADEVGQPLSRVITSGDPAGSPAATWATQVIRNSDGQVTEIRTPAAISAYTHDSGGNPAGTFTARAGAGLITTLVRAASGDTKGFVTDRKWQQGTGGTAFFDGSTAYTTAETTQTLTIGGATLIKPMISTRTAYTEQISSGSTGAITTSMTYAYFATTATDVQRFALKQQTTSLPVVSTGTNGPGGTAVTTQRYLRTDGTQAMTKNADGTFDYTARENGLQTRSTRDKAQDPVGGGGSLTSLLAEDTTTLSAWGLSSGDFSTAGFNATTATGYDAQGRVDTTTLPSLRVTKNYYTKLADGRMVTISIPRWVSTGTPTAYGPASYSVTNHSGKAEFQGTIAIAAAGTTLALSSWISTASSDPIVALSASAGTLARMSTTILNETGGTVKETRAYHTIPASGSGSAGTNYDVTLHAYDEMGRRIRTKDPTGTLARTVYDALGRGIELWTGTNDNGLAGGDVSGVNNMVKVAATEYDGGAGGGNSLVTKRTAYVEGSDTGKRETTFAYDVRGRVLLTTNPQAPHTLVKYDNLGRTLASAQYSSAGGITPGTTDPAGSAAGDKANRVALAETFYDEQGRVWKTLRHKITQSDGTSADTLATLNWYDDSGRLIKARGEQSVKRAYDRIGRQTHEFVLAKDDDAAYADAKTATGDIVLRETQTTYDVANLKGEQGSNNVIMAVTIDRLHDDLDNGVTGALDSNADNDRLTLTAADVKGRVAITATWYDELDRVTDAVFYGTNGIVGDRVASGGTFARSGLTVPARSDTTLRTTRTYNADGTLLQTEGPGKPSDPSVGAKTRSEYDALGRQTKVINNYADGVAGGGTNNDQDQIFTYEYTNGLRTKLTAVMPAGQGANQVTTYTYGVVKGVNPGDSKIASNRLLATAQYPDSSGGADVMSYAYNAQGAPIYVKDQAGNVIETDYDTGGRDTHRKVTTLASGFDGAVRRITSAYTTRGVRELITQYDNATPGSGAVVNEVKYAFDDWGNLAEFIQDRDSAVDTNAYKVTYTYAKAGAGTAASGAAGRNTLRRTHQRLLYNTTEIQAVQYGYDPTSSGNSLDDAASRVSSLTVGSTTVAAYRYLGAGQVVRINYPEPNVHSTFYSSTAGSYPGLDRFGRVVQSRWTKANSTPVDFYSVDLTYDRSSNILTTTDNILKNGSGTRVFDLKVALDDLSRVLDADEGQLTSGSIATRARRQQWTLTQAGNWSNVKVDLDGDGAYTATGEMNDTETFNAANEILTRDTDTNGAVNFTLTHDAAGNLTDDGKDYKYEYDAFGRLRRIKKTSDSSLVEEFVYNGVHHRIGWRYDADASGAIDAADPWWWLAYDESWRMLAMFRAGDTSPKETFVNHCAGAGGFGGSLGVDAVVLRDRDTNSGGTRGQTWWGTACDGVREDRLYFCQSSSGGGLRGDVVAMISASGAQRGQARYSAYGVPFGIPAGDINGDGSVNFSDQSLLSAWISASTYDVRGDLNLDGVVDNADLTILTGANYGLTLGRGNLSASPSGSTLTPGVRKGYAGYEHDGVNHSILHVRNRVLLGELGRWTRRDPMGYVDGVSLYEYVGGMPYIGLDKMGLRRGCIFIPEEGQPFWTSRACPSQPGCDPASLSAGGGCLAPPLGGGGGPAGSGPGSNCDTDSDCTSGGGRKCKCRRYEAPGPPSTKVCCSHDLGDPCTPSTQSRCASGRCVTNECWPNLNVTDCWGSNPRSGNCRDRGSLCNTSCDCPRGQLCIQGSNNTYRCTDYAGASDPGCD